jgi:pimeloyl-ACP methyl ester carboxylesterase
MNTNEYLTKCEMPVVIFHGDADEVIPLQMGQQLWAMAKPGDSLIVLEGQGHMDMTGNRVYLKALLEILQPGDVLCRLP